jgi:ABC-type glycerol-3-phosphate transport system substrate-binding protein
VDVFMMPYRYIKDNEVASELGTFIYSEENDALDKFYPSVIEMSKNQGDLKGMPWIGHSMSLIYNVDLCDEAGVDPKKWTDIDDLIQGGLAITEATDAKGLGLIGADNYDSTWMVNQFIYSFGGSLVELDENNNFVQVIVNSDESVRALDFYKNELGPLAQDGWEEDTGADVIESFGNEEIAFEIQGPWGITDVWKNGSTFEVGAIPLSQIGMYSEVGPIMLAMDKDLSDEEGVQDFIRYLNTEEALNILLTGEYEPKFQAYFPFRVPIMNDDSMDFYELYPEFISFTKGFEKPSINTPCPEWASDYEDKYQGILHDIFVENITIEQGLMGVAK